jgi:hypothetical protein
MRRYKERRDVNKERMVELDTEEEEKANDEG